MRVPTDLRLSSVITPGVTLAKRKIVSLSGLKSLDGLRNKTNLNADRPASVGELRATISGLKLQN